MIRIRKSHLVAQAALALLFFLLVVLLVPGNVFAQDSTTPGGGDPTGGGSGTDDSGRDTGDGDSSSDDGDDDSSSSTDDTPSGPADSDGDGTPDDADRCPSQSGPDFNGGCPVSVADALQTCAATGASDQALADCAEDLCITNPANCDDGLQLTVLPIDEVEPRVQGSAAFYVEQETEFASFGIEDIRFICAGISSTIGEFTDCVDEACGADTGIPCEPRAFDAFLYFPGAKDAPEPLLPDTVLAVCEASTSSREETLACLDRMCMDASEACQDFNGEYAFDENGNCLGCSLDDFFELADPTQEEIEYLCRSGSTTSSEYFDCIDNTCRLYPDSCTSSVGTVGAETYVVISTPGSSPSDSCTTPICKIVDICKGAPEGLPACVDNVCLIFPWACIDDDGGGTETILIDDLVIGATDDGSAATGAADCTTPICKIVDLCQAKDGSIIECVDQACRVFPQHCIDDGSDVTLDILGDDAFDDITGDGFDDIISGSAAGGGTRGEDTCTTPICRIVDFCQASPEDLIPCVDQACRVFPQHCIDVGADLDITNNADPGDTEEAPWCDPIENPLEHALCECIGEQQADLTECIEIKLGGPLPD